MAFSDFELTNAGINLLGQVSTGQPLIFTKIQLGDGDFTGTVKELTSVFNSFIDADITDVVIQEDNSVNIKSEFNNNGFLTPKEWKEIGIFAKAGETGTEVLYSYSYSLLAVETIPAFATKPYRRDLNFRNYISDATNVTYNITIQKDKYDFDSDVAMQSATYLADGDRVNVWKSDSCQKRRVSTVGNNGILLNNGLYANLILDIQGKYDSSLVTISKYVIPAINEVKSNLDANTGGPTEGNIQDVGTKEAGKVYKDTATNKLFLCIQTTTSTVNSTTYFEDITNLGLNTKINSEIKIIETGSNSNGFWRKYSDGLIEQWGVSIDSITGLNQTFTNNLPIPFSDLSYVLVGNVKSDVPAPGNGITSIYFLPNTTSSFTWVSDTYGTGPTGKIMWRAIGY